MKLQQLVNFSERGALETVSVLLLVTLLLIAIAVAVWAGVTEPTRG